MPIIFFILLVLLIAHIGFWDALGAILGAAVMMVLLFLLVVGVLVFGALAFARRLLR